jgi:predicted amino acid-binding ACT domain protein
MATKTQKVEYYYCNVKDQPGESYKLLVMLAEVGVNLLAFTAVPSGLLNTQFTLFPEDPQKLKVESQKAGLAIHGPIPALLVQGDDQIGVLTDIHKKLFDNGINVVASNAVTDGKGGFGYVIYLRTEEFEKAADILNISE